MSMNRTMNQCASCTGKEKAIVRDIFIRKVIPAMKVLNEALDDLVATKAVLYKEGVIDTNALDGQFGRILESRAKLCAVLQETMDGVNDKSAHTAA